MSVSMKNISFEDRIEEFYRRLGDVNMEPVSPFQPLDPKQLDELKLIRDISLELQKKRLEEDRKAAEAAKASEPISEIKEVVKEVMPEKIQEK